MQKEQGKNQTEQPKRGKSKGKPMVWIALSVTVLAVAALFFLILFRNLFGGRDLLVTWLVSQDPAYQTVADRENRAALREEELEKRESELEEKEAAAAKREAELEKKLSRANSMASRLAAVSESHREQMQWLGDIYSAMEPEQAARAIETLPDVGDIALVLYYMDEKSIVEVMNCMDAKLAGEVTKYMLE